MTKEQIEKLATLANDKKHDIEVWPACIFYRNLLEALNQETTLVEKQLDSLVEFMDGAIVSERLGKMATPKGNFLDIYRDLNQPMSPVRNGLILYGTWCSYLKEASITMRRRRRTKAEMEAARAAGEIENGEDEKQTDED